MIAVRAVSMRVIPMCAFRHRPAAFAAAILMLAALAAFATVGAIAPGTAIARGPAPAGEIHASALPKEAQDVLARIHAGGPFRYSRDGIVFGNREHLLPAEKRGYYHEYTVRTPGARDRGARRIICGGARRAPAACWYTDDHYASFRRIRE